MAISARKSESDALVDYGLVGTRTLQVQLCRYVGWSVLGGRFRGGRPEHSGVWFEESIICNCRALQSTLEIRGRDVLFKGLLEGLAFLNLLLHLF